MNLKAILATIRQRRQDKKRKVDLNMPTVFQSVFLQSKANGAEYREDGAITIGWEWPKKTWLQQRLENSRKGKR